MSTLFRDEDINKGHGGGESFGEGEMCDYAVGCCSHRRSRTSGLQTGPSTSDVAKVNKTSALPLAISRCRCLFWKLPGRKMCVMKKL